MIMIVIIVLVNLQYYRQCTLTFIYVIDANDSCNSNYLVYDSFHYVLVKEHFY